MGAVTNRQAQAVEAVRIHVARHGHGMTIGQLAAALVLCVDRASRIVARLDELGAIRVQRSETGRTVAVWPVVTVCHAGAGHGPAEVRGAWGALCEPCWSRVRALFAVGAP